MKLKDFRLINYFKYHIINLRFQLITDYIYEIKCLNFFIYLAKLS